LFLPAGCGRICWNVPQETDAEKIARLEHEIEQLKQEIERLRRALARPGTTVHLPAKN
jgi:predicted  nucleic acid-binding Zn-ribbon protein